MTHEHTPCKKLFEGPIQYRSTIASGIRSIYVEMIEGKGQIIAIIHYQLRSQMEDVIDICAALVKRFDASPSGVVYVEHHPDPPPRGSWGIVTIVARRTAFRPNGTCTLQLYKAKRRGMSNDDWDELGIERRTA